MKVFKRRGEANSVGAALREGGLALISIEADSAGRRELGV
jgi:hypothetical protein